MDKETNRRSPKGLMKTKMTIIKFGTSTEIGSHPNGSDTSPVYDQAHTRECSDSGVVRLKNGNKQLIEEPEDQKMDLNKEDLFFRRDASCSAGQSDYALIAKTTSVKRVRPRVFARKTQPDRIPRPDIGVNVERERFSQERNCKKTSRYINTPPKSSRRMSCPGNISNSFPNERLGASTTGVLLPKRKTQNSKSTSDKSRHVLPKLIESIETLKTEDESKSQGNEINDAEMRSINSSSPRSFYSGKSTDQVLISDPLDVKKNIVMSSLPTRSEGNSNDQTETPTYKNKIIETTLDVKQQDIVPPRFFNSPIQNGVESTSKIKIEGKQIINIDLVHLSASDDGLMTRSISRKQVTRRNATTSPQRAVTFRPKSRTSPCNDETKQDSHSAKISEEELNLKVLTFLKSTQPKASPGTLRVKGAKKAVKPVLTSYPMREQRGERRGFINTDTCPSNSHLINQDRSWYYQDRKGKCRYLRVPESPVPPVEWVFQKDDSY